MSIQLTLSQVAVFRVVVAGRYRVPCVSIQLTLSQVAVFRVVVRLVGTLCVDSTDPFSSITHSRFPSINSQVFRFDSPIKPPCTLPREMCVHLNTRSRHSSTPTSRYTLTTNMLRTCVKRARKREPLCV